MMIYESASSGSGAKMATVNVTDVNEAPSAGDVTASAAETSDDTTIFSTVVGSERDTLAETDEDLSNNTYNDLSYAINGGNLDGLFEIDANGNLTMRRSIKASTRFGRPMTCLALGPRRNSYFRLSQALGVHMAIVINTCLIHARG
jgi:hypothetical protein